MQVPLARFLRSVTSGERGLLGQRCSSLASERAGIEPMPVHSSELSSAPTLVPHAPDRHSIREGHHLLVERQRPPGLATEDRRVDDVRRCGNDLFRVGHHALADEASELVRNAVRRQRSDSMHAVEVQMRGVPVYRKGPAPHPRESGHQSWNRRLPGCRMSVEGVVTRRRCPARCSCRRPRRRNASGKRARVCSGRCRPG
jgi:hypothetical protein